MDRTDLMTPRGSFSVSGAGAFATDTSFDQGDDVNEPEHSFLQRSQSLGTPGTSVFQSARPTSQPDDGLQAPAESSDEGDLTENDVDLLMGALGDDDDQEEASSSSDGGDFEPLGRQESIKSRLSFNLPVLEGEDGPSTDAFEPIERAEDGENGNDDDSENESRLEEGQENDEDDGGDEASSPARDDDRADMATEPASETSGFLQGGPNRKRMRPGGPVQDIPSKKQPRPADDWSEAQAVSSLISAPFL